MKRIFEFLLKDIKLPGGSGGGGYNISTGAITHPPRGTGKSPKVTSTTRVTKPPKKK